MAIQNRRGAFTDFDPTKMVAGEFAVVQSGDENTEDGKALYVAPTTGSVKRIPFADELGDLVEIDDTLTEAGAAADAKKTGDEIADLKSDLSDVNERLDNLDPGLSDDAKAALMNCFAHVAWDGVNGQSYYNALVAALNISKRRPELPDIYEQVEYITGPDSRTKYIITDVVSQLPFRCVAKVEFVGIGCIISAGSGGTGRFVPMMHNYPIGQSLGPNTISQRFGNTGWFYIPDYQVPLNELLEIESNVIQYGSNEIKTSLTVGDLYAEQVVTTPTGLGTPINIHRLTIDGYITSNATKIYELKFYSNITLLFDAIPCYRKADNISGLYDAVSGQFYPGEGEGVYLVGDVVR